MNTRISVVHIYSFPFDVLGWMCGSMSALATPNTLRKFNISKMKGRNDNNMRMLYLYRRRHSLCVRSGHLQYRRAIHTEQTDIFVRSGAVDGRALRTGNHFYSFVYTSPCSEEWTAGTAGLCWHKCTIFYCSVKIIPHAVRLSLESARVSVSAAGAPYLSLDFLSVYFVHLNACWIPKFYKRNGDV